MEPMPERWSEVREHLLPVVRGICRPPGSLTRMNTDPSRAPIRRPLAPFLSELVVVDGEMTRQYVTPRQLEQWGVDAHRVFHAARGNLAPTEGLGRVGDFFALAAGDGYDSSRLVLPGWLEAFSGLVQGVPVVAAPDARSLLVCDSADEDAVAALAARAFEGYRQAGDPVSPGLYARVDGDLVPYLVSSGPLAALLRRNQLVLAGQQYRLQQQELESEIRLGDFTVYAGPGFAVSMCRVVLGQPCAVPVVDVVLLESEDGQLKTVEWPHVLAASEGEPLAELVPPRFAWRGLSCAFSDLPEAPFQLTPRQA